MTIAVRKVLASIALACLLAGVSGAQAAPDNPYEAQHARDAAVLKSKGGKALETGRAWWDLNIKFAALEAKHMALALEDLRREPKATAADVWHFEQMLAEGNDDGLPGESARAKALLEQYSGPEDLKWIEHVQRDIESKLNNARLQHESYLKHRP